MSETAYRRHFEDILAQIQQPARLIGGEFGAGPGFGEDPAELRVVLGFPDTYEVGISNQALQILYHLARETAGAAVTAGVAVERTYLPWIDASAAMRREGISLLTLESWSPVATADLFAVTLQHEFNYTNLLEMLDLAGIPLCAEKRTDEHPLVLAGGPACANFLPMSPFLDAVAVGEGEEVFPEILAVLAAAKREGIAREAVKERLSDLEGVFVPGLSHQVVRRAITRLAGAPYPEGCLVPLTAGVHDRAWVEIMRGCTRGCRFCQAGMWYRPVRERPPDEVLRMAGAQLANSGHQELAFASLSTTDYSGIGPLLESAAAAYPEVRISLPSLRVDSAAVRLASLVSPTGPSLTLAPEAGSQRMRDIINKNVTEGDVLAAAEEAFRGGRTTLKLYFMIGLPFEEDTDVVAIADLCLKVRTLGREILGSRAGRLQLNLSVNNFVPKPFTPFQWVAMADRETILRRQGLLRSRLRRSGIRLVVQEPGRGYLEAALARGGEEMGAVIEGAWRRGARFDSWTAEFRADAWADALAEAGMSAEELATTAIPPEAALPWDVVRGTVDRDFLWREWEKASRGEATADCRWDVCSTCGACGGSPRNDLATGRGGGAAAAAAKAPPPHHLVPASATVGGANSDAAPGSALPSAVGPHPAVRRRYAATFSVSGRGRFIGHLDRAEVFRRAVRKAGGRLALSAGMRPKPLLSLALPLAVGVEGRRELCEFELAEDPGPDFTTWLAASLPDHMRLRSLEPYSGARSLAARVVAASYEVVVSVAPGPAGAGAAAPQAAAPQAAAPQAAAPQAAAELRLGGASESGHDLCAVLTAAADGFRRSPELVVEEMREGRVRRVDVKRYVDAVSVRPGPGGSCTLAFRAAMTPDGTARPERVVDALGRLAGIGLLIKKIERIEVHLS